MLSLLEIRTVQGTMLSLPLEDISDGIVLEDIEGLDPVKATLVSSSFAQMDGEQYHSSRREARNIKLKFGLQADFVVSTVRDLRTRLYSYLMPKSFVRLRFYDSGGLVVEIGGRVESHETPLFSSEPEVNVSIMCFDPDFVELTPIDISGNTVSDSTNTAIEYFGTVETGITLVLSVDRALTEFTIYHQAPDDSIRTLDFAAVLQAGDTLTINTNAGAKGATLLRGTTQSSLLYGISPQANWIEFSLGVNNFRVYAEGAAIPYTLSYTPRYGGL